MSFYLRTLGQLTLHPEGPDSESVLSESKSLVILALLAVAPDHSMARDHLSELLWPGTEHRKARRSLRQSLYYLSQQAGADLIESENAHVRLIPEAFDCDLWELDRAIRAQDDEVVVDGFSGRFLESVERKVGRELAEWVDLQNQRLRSARRDASSRLVEWNLSKGRKDEAIRFARDYAARHPLDEQAQLQLIRALKHVGDEAGAFRAYEEYRSLVRSAVQDEPSDEMEKAVETVRHLLLADREWKPIAADEPEALTVTKAKRYAGWLVTAGVVVGAGAATLGMAVIDVEPAPAPNSRLDLLDARLSVTLGGAAVHDTVGRRDLLLDGTDWELVPTTVPGFMGGVGIVAPDGRTTAYTASFPGERAIDLYLAREDSPPRLLFTGAGDQNPLAWSPDGRKLLVGLGSVDPETYQYSESLAFYDLDSDQLSTAFRTYTNRMKTRAYWSPDGTRLAVEEDAGGQYDVRIFSADGVESELLGGSELDERHPAWSTDGRRLAYSVGAAGRTRVVVRDLETDSARVLTENPWSEDTPLWLSNRILAFVRDVDGERDVWARDIELGEVRQVTYCRCIGSIELYLTAPPAGPWLDGLVASAATRVVPGDTIAPLVRATWSDRGVGAPPALRLTTTDSAIVVPLEDGRLAIRGPGTVEAVLSAGGWRADTLTIRSAPLVRSELEPVFVETWTEGIGERRWMLGGEPTAYSRGEGGPEGAGVFVNNGDIHYESGVLSVDWFSTGEGFTVEAWGRVETTGLLHQTYSLQLVATPGPPPSPRPFMGEMLRFGLLGHTGQTWIDRAGERVSFARPEDSLEWHLYTLQVDPEGTVDYLIDGKLVRRERNFIDPTVMPDSVRLALGSRSFGTEVMHGVVRVYEGPLFVRR